MCLISGCDKLWQDNVVLENITCPCGHRYWDIFQERFIDARDRKFGSSGRALPMKARESALKTRMGSKKFEGSIRAQFIIHCISCGIRRRIDDGEADAGFDDLGFLRAMSELQEIANGDYTSRGRSRTFQEIQTPLPFRPQEVSRRTRQISLSEPAADLSRPARTDHSSGTRFYSDPRSRQEPSLTQIASIQEGTRTSSDSQRGARRGSLLDVVSAEEDDPVSEERTPITTRSSDNIRIDPRLRYGINRDTPNRSTSRGYGSTDERSGPHHTLSPLLLKFVAFGDDQYDSIATFCDSNPEIWDENGDDLQPVIMSYLRGGELDKARRLAQRLLMLTLAWRRSSSPEEQQRWLNRLSRSTQLRDELDAKVDVLLERLSTERSRR